MINKKTNKSISVIIPAHNEGKLVIKSINSIKEQFYSEEIEIIVACNDCTDNTAELAKNLGVKVLSAKKSGMGFGKNLGGKQASGEILLFLDADSTLLPGSLAAINKLAQNQHLIVGTMLAFLEQPTIFEKFVIRLANWIQYLRRLPTPCGALFITNELYKKINGFNEDIPQGTSSDLVLRAINTGGTWCFLRQAGAVTSPRRIRKVGIVKQMFSWIHNVHLLKKKRLDTLQKRDYDNIR